MQPLPKSVPFGRLPDLIERPDADLLAVRTPRALFGDYAVKRYASRLALETFLRNPGDWRAVVKTPVPPAMLTDPAFQRPE